MDTLDKFTSLISNIDKEIELRQKQYEHYREKLLTFNDGECEWKKLVDVGKFINGLTGKTKNDFIDGNAKFISYINVYSNYTVNFNVEDKVKIQKGEKQNALKYGDILFTTSSETPDECGMSSVVEDELSEDVYFNSFCFCFRFNDLTNLEPKFYKHLFRTTKLREKITKTANGVTRYNVSKNLFGKIEIPLPPLHIQKKIAETLDKFTWLISCLWRERVLRQKQYEYYREKLLTF